jgi:hypothetical protein
MSGGGHHVADAANAYEVRLDVLIAASHLGRQLVCCPGGLQVMLDFMPLQGDTHVGYAQVVETTGIVRVVPASRLKRFECPLPVALAIPADALRPVSGRRIIKVIAWVRVVVRVRI